MCNGRIYNDVGGGNEIKIDISPLTQITGGMRFQVLVTTDKTNNNLSFNVNNSDQTIQTMPIYDKTIYRNIPVGSIPNPSILEFVCYPILIEDDTIAGMILLDISTQDLYLKDKQIHNLANASNPTDAVNLGQQTAAINTCLPLNGSRGMTGNLNLNNRQIKAVADATVNGDAVNLGQQTAAIDTCLPLDGSRNMTGNINFDLDPNSNLPTRKITGLANGTDLTDAVNLGQLNACLPLDGSRNMNGNINLNNNKIINVAPGTNLNDIVNVKQLKESINYYIATPISENLVSIDISPLTSLVKGFTFYGSFAVANTGAFTIRVIGANNANLGDIRVLDSARDILNGGEITANSTRQFVFGKYGNNPTVPTFILLNPDVPNNIKYVNQSIIANDTSTSRGVTAIRFNNNICMQSGVLIMNAGYFYITITLPIPMKDANYCAITTFMTQTNINFVVQNNIHVYPAIQDNTRIVITIYPQHWHTLTGAPSYLTIAWSVSGLCK